VTNDSRWQIVAGCWDHSARRLVPKRRGVYRLLPDRQICSTESVIAEGRTYRKMRVFLYCRTSQAASYIVRAIRSRKTKSAVYTGWVKFKKVGKVRITQLWGNCRGKAVSITYLPVCVCARARALLSVGVRELGSLHERAFIHPFFFFQHETRVRHIVISFVASVSTTFLHIFS
jgi:hypothetical protein